MKTWTEQEVKNLFATMTINQVALDREGNVISFEAENEYVSADCVFSSNEWWAECGSKNFFRGGNNSFPTLEECFAWIQKEY